MEEIRKSGFVEKLSEKLISPEKLFSLGGFGDTTQRISSACETASQSQIILLDPKVDQGEPSVLLRMAQLIQEKHE